MTTPINATIMNNICFIYAFLIYQNLTECEEKYKNEPRGPSCYCTMFHGCYHKHFYVKPKIVKDAGLTPRKDKGVHDSDYYVEVTVINNALNHPGPCLLVCFTSRCKYAMYIDIQGRE
jgi:hypothetical protein